MSKSISFQFSSVQFSCSVLSNSLRPRESQHTRPSCLSPTPRVHSDHVHQSVMPSSHLILYHPLLLLPQSLPASKSFPMSQHFARGGQSTGVSALASFLPKNTHPGLISFRMDWLDPLAVQGTLKSLLQHHSSKHQFFGTQLSS